MRTVVVMLLLMLSGCAATGHQISEQIRNDFIVTIKCKSGRGC